MRILLTGHKGYIGTIMAPMLQAEGFEVVGLDTDLYAQCTFGNQMPQVPSIQKDVRDVQLADLEGFDAVIHLAGLSNDPLGDLNPRLTYEINYEASVRLARLAKRAGVGRFLFSSSCSVYGASGGDMIDEHAPFYPVTPYGKSKVYVEQLVSKLADETFCPTFLRNATAYGASPRIRFDLVLNNLTAWAYATGRVHLKGDGTAWRPLVHIEDISRAFVAVLQAPVDAVHNEAFNVGSTDENYRIRELAEIVEAAVPKCAVEYAQNAEADKRCYRVNCDKIAEKLNFRPQWTAQKGARELYEAFRSVEVMGVEDFEGPRYSRVAHIKSLLRWGLVDDRLRPQKRARVVVER